MDLQRLTDGKNTLLSTRDRALDKKEVVVDLTVVGEATHGGDGLLGLVEVGGSVGLVLTLTDTVDLVVERGTAVETVLTRTGDSPLHVVGVPRTNAGNLTKTTVSLTGKLGGTPTGSNTLVTFTLGDGGHINVLLVLEDRRDVDGLLEVLLSPGNLVGNGATVDLDLSKVGLLLANRSLADLGVGEDTDNRGVLGDALELGLDRRGALSVLLGVRSEGLLLGLVPVLVEAALDLITKVLGPHGGKASEALGGLDVANNTNNNEGWGVYNGGSLNNLPLVHLGTTTVKVTDNGGHTGLVTEEGGEVDWLALVVLGESLHPTTGRGRTLAGQECQRTGAGLFVLTVGHFWSTGQSDSPRKSE